MATTINAYSVSLGLNVAGLVEGGKLARSETAAVVRALKNMVEPAEEIKNAINLMEDALNADAISKETYTLAVTKLRDELYKLSDAYKQEQEAIQKDNRLIAEGERLAKKHMTAQEQHAQELRKLKELYSIAAIGAETYARALDDANDRLQKANTITATIVEDPPVVKHAKQTETASDSIVKSVKGIVVGYIGLQGIQSAYSALKESSERIDDLQNRSHQLGESVPNLQRYQFALSQMANIDIAGADQMLVRMTRTLGSAKTGSQEAIDTFQRLGVDLAQMAAMSPVQQFTLISDALARIQDPAVRAAEATKIFGKEGAALLPIFAEGEGAVAGMMAEAERLGLVLSQQDAEKVAAMNDQFERMAGQLQIIVDKTLVAMTPAIAGITGMFEDQNGILSYVSWTIGKMVDGFSLMFAIGQEVLATIYDMGLALYKASQGDFSFFGKVTEFDKINGFLDRYEAAQRTAGNAPQAPQIDAEVQAAAEAEAKKTTEYEKQVAELEKQILVMERGEVVARQMELAAQGYTDAEIERLETLREQLDEMKRQEQAARDLAKEQEQLKQADQKAFDDRMKQINNMKFENPEARQAGSAAAIDFVNKQGREETDKQLKAVLEQKAIQDKQLAELKRSNDLLVKLVDTKPTAIR